jgi:hypothetical protein
VGRAELDIRWPDGTLHHDKSAFGWISEIKRDWDRLKAKGITNVAFCTTNEPGAFDKLVLWHTRRDANGSDRPNLAKGVMDYAAELGIPLSVLHSTSQHKLAYVQPSFVEQFPELTFDMRGRRLHRKIAAGELPVEQPTGRIVHQGCGERVIISTEVDALAAVANARLPLAGVETHAFVLAGVVDRTPFVRLVLAAGSKTQV